MLRYLISILIGGILLLIFKDWLGISRKHPPRQKTAHQPDATSEHEPETIASSTSNVHQPAIIAQSAPNEHGQSILDEHKPTLAAQYDRKSQPNLGNTEMLANPASKHQDQANVPPKTDSKAPHDDDFSSKPRAKSKRSPFKSWFSFKRPVNWSTAAQPLNWSNLLTTKPISNAAYLEQLQQWDRHLSMVADHDEIATQARQNFSDAQKNAFFQDPFPGLRFLAYEMAKTYSWYSHGTDRSPHELAMLSKDLKGIIQLHERATQLLQGDIGERRVYQLLQELYPHEELLDSLNLPFDYYKKQNTAAVNQIDIILITRNGVLIPEVKNYQGLALQLTKDGR